MATGYLPTSATNTTGLDYNAMLYCKTNIAGYFFDGFMEVSLTSELQITENPVETGASIVDHSYVKPLNLTMKIKMSDVLQSIIPGQFTGGWSRSVTAYKVLKEIQSNRIPVSVLSKFGLHENMLIKSISVTDTDETWLALDATVNLVEIPIARVKTVEISAASQTTIKTEMAKIQPVDADDKSLQSILYMLSH